MQLLRLIFDSFYTALMFSVMLVISLFTKTYKDFFRFAKVLGNSSVQLAKLSLQLFKLIIKSQWRLLCLMCLKGHIAINKFRMAGYNRRTAELNKVLRASGYTEQDIKDLKK